MKKLALTLSCCFAFLEANSIEELVNKTLVNNSSLKAIETKLSISDENIKLSQKLKDPILSLGVNDIQFENPFKRDLEPMQTQYIGISQEFISDEKLKLKKQIAIKDKELASLELEDKKLLLKTKVYELSYLILLQKQKLKLLNSYEKNINKLKKFSSTLYKFGKSSQNEVLNAKVSLLDVKIQKQKLKNQIDNLYLKLEQIVYEKVDKLENDLKMEKLVLNMNDSHPFLLLQEKKALKFKNLAKLEKENEKPNIKVNLAYFNRFDYKDYANVSVNIPLSIYKTQESKAIKAKLEASQIRAKTIDIKKAFQRDFELLQNNSNLAYSNYMLIKKQILPLKRKIQKNLENYNSFSQIKPQKAIANLNELISYELKALNEKSDYFLNYAKLKYYEDKAF